jgi:outer membrane protein
MSTNQAALFAAIALTGFAGGTARAETAPTLDTGEQNVGAECVDGVCHVRLTADKLLQNAERLVGERRFAEAAPMLAALEHAPEFAMQRQFLSGYSAVETGDLDTAVKQFRAALVNHPEQTRIRLELARALMLQGKNASADHHFRLAGTANDLPEDVLATISSARGVLRSQKQWGFNFNLGLAPDSNITNGSSATTVDANFGGQSIPLALDANARAKSGLGQTLSLGGTARFGLFGETKLVVESDVQGVNYKGKASDDFTGQLAVGPSFQLSEKTNLTVQALGSQRYYGGQRGGTGLGGRAGFQFNLNNANRLGITIDARHNNSGFASSYSGWQFGGYASYERVVAKSFIASASLFARRESLRSKIHANTEMGFNLGFGGELPMGLTAGISAGASKAVFDKPFEIFSLSPRKDIRLNARATVGLRKFRWLGFSPSVSFSYSKSASSLSLYDSSRKRVAFSFARYF